MRRRSTVLFALLLVGGMAALVAGDARIFPGPPTDTDPRANTPNDPDFDKADPAAPDKAVACPAGGCGVFDEQHRLFGFAPNGTKTTALYHDPSRPDRLNQPQISGVSADLAWKLSIGEQTTDIAICDTGIQWDREELRRRVRLNTGELPVPCGPTAGQKGRPLAEYDCDGDGIFTAEDYGAAAQPQFQVRPDEGPHGDPTKLDAEDVLVHFSDGVDDDGNGFVDDIAGWDFFDDDNNPFDASSYSSANNHGSGRAEDAAEEGNDANAGLGVCPNCQIEPMRVWDTFVVDTNNFAQAALYAADNNIEVVEGAVGGLFNSSFARNAFDYAYRHGVFFAIVSSDLNTADHNIPTVYNEAMQVQGTVADVQGLGTSPPSPPPGTPQPIVDFYRSQNVLLSQ